MVGQWQGDIDNDAIALTISALGHVIQMWESAKPVQQQAPVQNTPPTP